VTLNRSNVTRGLGRNHLPNLTFVAVWTVLAAVGCSSDSGTAPLPVGTAGAAAGTGTVVAGSGTGAAGMIASPAGTGTTGAAGMGTTGAAGSTTTTPPAGAAGAAPTGPAPTLTQIYDSVYVTNCAVCHGMVPNVNTNGNLGPIKNKDAFYMSLVNKPTQGPACMGKGMYIVPGQPAMSVLLQKVSTTPPCGVEMPVGGMLMASDVKLLTDWVAAGALNN
jgi:mono/diheme cytochrome c family protein